MRILIAEDEVEIARALKVLLEKNKCTADIVHNGKDAWDYICQSSYDVIVLDIMMPGMDGLKVLQRVRESHNFTPVMLLTAKSEIEDRVAGLNAGADDYLPKPFAVSEFIARVKALGRRNTNYVETLLCVGNTTLDCNRYSLMLLWKSKQFGELVIPWRKSYAEKDEMAFHFCCHDCSFYYAGVACDRNQCVEFLYYSKKSRPENSGNLHV